MVKYQAEGELKFRDADPRKPIVIAQHISGIASKTRGLQRLDQVRPEALSARCSPDTVGSVIHRPLLDTHPPRWCRPRS